MPEGGTPAASVFPRKKEVESINISRTATGGNNGWQEERQLSPVVTQSTRHLCGTASPRRVKHEGQMAESFDGGRKRGRGVNYSEYTRDLII